MGRTVFPATFDWLECTAATVSVKQYFDFPFKNLL